MNFEGITGPVGSVTSRVLSVGRRHRRVWVVPGRAHVDVRGTGRPGAESLARAVEDRLRSLKGVDWAEVNAITGRVVVAFDGDGVDVDDVLEVVESVEEAHGVHHESFENGQPDHPGDRQPLQRNVVALVADAIGLGLTGVTQLVRLTPLSTELASMVSVVDATPRLRRVVDQRLGPAGDLGLAVLNAAAQGMSQGPVGLVVDIGHRVGMVGEITARNRAWDRREPELVGHGPVGAEEMVDRPEPMPPGPIEHTTDRLSLSSVAAFGLSLASRRDPRSSE